MEIQERSNLYHTTVEIINFPCNQVTAARTNIKQRKGQDEYLLPEIMPNWIIKYYETLHI